MRAKLISETVSFHRGETPKDAMGIGYNEDVIHFLEGVRNDYQFDKSDPENYYGCINIGGDHNAGGPAFMDEDMERGYRKFLEDWRRYLRLMADWGLYMVDPPRYGETLIYDEPEPSYGVHAIRESVNFERGNDPKKSMRIGHQAHLKNEAAKIDWDWYPDPEELEEEEIIDLKQYGGFNTKIAKIESSKSAEPYYKINPDGSIERKYKYYAVSDTGEPYFEAPTFYEDPEDAWEYEKKWLQDEYVQKNQ